MLVNIFSEKIIIFSFLCIPEEHQNNDHLLTNNIHTPNELFFIATIRKKKD